MPIVYRICCGRRPFASAVRQEHQFCRLPSDIKIEDDRLASNLLWMHLECRIDIQCLWRLTSTAALVDVPENMDARSNCFESLAKLFAA